MGNGGQVLQPMRCQRVRHDVGDHAGHAIAVVLIGALVQAHGRRVCRSLRAGT